MEYISMSLQEASEYQSKFKYLEGTEFTYWEDKKRYVVVAITISPSEASKLKEFAFLMSQCDMGFKSKSELERFTVQYTSDKFIPILFARIISSENPGHISLPLSLLGTSSGSLEFGFGL